MQDETPDRAQPQHPSASRDRSPFHPGEQALQARVGVRDRVERFGRRFIRDYMSDQHRAFFAELPFVVVGGLDLRNRPRASVLTGAPGFMSSADPRTLRVDALPADRDPIGAGLFAGAAVGVLGIQPETRRRNRLNGTVVGRDRCGFFVRVQQSFGNCPQYIQARTPVQTPHSAQETRRVRSESVQLSTAAAALVARADTFFIATASPFAKDHDPAEGVDVSHRGGKPGFVRVSEEDGRSVLTAPDFAGNQFFNSFGNLLRNPRAGIVFVDFESGHLLSLAGDAEVLWDGPEITHFTGAQRLLRFCVSDGVWIDNGVPLRWSAPEWAPQLAATGSWEDVARAKIAASRFDLLQHAPSDSDLAKR
jgi:predicted pyridoxine 5'-phosphate oxidase superfamily flavin-nucleotide-binding protein